MDDMKSVFYTVRNTIYEVRFTKLVLFLIIVNCSLLIVKAQPRSTGINNKEPNLKSALDVKTTNGFKQGFLMPRLTTADTNNIGVTLGQDKGMMFFDTLSGVVRYWNGSKWGSVASSAGGGEPVGTIMAFAGASVPSGYLVCDGSAISRTNYAELFAAIAIAWGAGNGTTTFNLPDLRGRFLRGLDGGSGNDPDANTRTASGILGNTGNNVGSLQLDTFATHQHEYFSNSPANAGTPFNVWGNGPTMRIVKNNNGTSYTRNSSLTSPIGSTETRPKNAYVYYIIKYAAGSTGGAGGGGAGTSQTLSISTNTLSISGGNSITLPLELPITATPGQVLKYKSGQWQAGNDSVGSNAPKLAVYQEYYPGTFPASAVTTLNAWVNIPLNTAQFASNTTDIAVSGSTITLQPGTYRIKGFANFDLQGSGSATYEMKSRLLNTTSSATAIWGSKMLSNSNISNISVTLNSQVEGIVTVASATTFTYQRYVFWTPSSSLQLGITTFANTPGDQVMSQMSIERLY